jgi:ubiquitin C-terminal hydrolase
MNSSESDTDNSFDASPEDLDHHRDVDEEYAQIADTIAPELESDADRHDVTPSHDIRPSTQSAPITVPLTPALASTEDFFIFFDDDTCLGVDSFDEVVLQQFNGDPAQRFTREGQLIRAVHSGKWVSVDRKLVTVSNYSDSRWTFCPDGSIHLVGTEFYIDFNALGLDAPVVLSPHKYRKFNIVSVDDASRLDSTSGRSNISLLPQPPLNDASQFVDSTSHVSTAAPLSRKFPPVIPDIGLNIEQNCGKIDGYVLERHCYDTFQCCSLICKSLYALDSNSEVTDLEPFEHFQRFPGTPIPFLVFPYLDLNHEVQMLDRFSRLCHAELYTDYQNSQGRCVQQISHVLSARLLSLLQEYELVTRCVEADAPFLSKSLASNPPFELLATGRSRSSSPVPLPSQNLGAKRAVTFADNSHDHSHGLAGRTSPVLECVNQTVLPASLRSSSASEFKDDHPDRCCALLWGLKNDESDKLHPCRTCRCSEPALPDGRLCERHSRIPKLELLGTLPLDSFDRLNQHRSHMDALKIIFSQPLSPDPSLYLKSVMKRLSMIIDRCRAMMTCSQRFLKTYNKSYLHNEHNFHRGVCERFCVFGKFASALIFRISSHVPDSMSFISGEHGCASSFIADPCKTFFFDGFGESDHDSLDFIFASISDFAVISCRNLVDRFRLSSQSSVNTQAIFQSLDKLSSFIKNVCLLWGSFKTKWPRLSFPFGLFSSSMFLSSLLLYSPFSLPRVLASLDLLHSTACLMNFCSSSYRSTSTSKLSIEFGLFIDSIQKLKFTSAEECASALSLFDSFLNTVGTNKEYQVEEGACPISVAETLCGSVFNFLNVFQMQNESAAGICALLRNAKCWARREESCRFLVTFLASSHDSCSIDSILSILPWENRYDEDWVEVESFALQSMVCAAEARPIHLQQDFLEDSMKRILSCARMTAENRRSMCEVAIELLKVLACGGFRSTMFRDVLVQVDQELFSATSPPLDDGMKLFLQIVDIIVNKFPDLIQEVTKRWILTLQQSNARFSVVSSAILLSSILRLRSEHVDEKLFSVDDVIPKFSQLLSDSNDDSFFKLEESVVHLLTLCRNIYVVQRSMPSVQQIKQLQTVLSASSSKVRDALYNTILSPALFYLNLTQGMLDRAPSTFFTPIQLSLRAAFGYLLTLDDPDRISYLRKFTTDFCSNAVSALQTPAPEAETSAQFLNLFRLQLCSWPNVVSDSKVPRDQTDAVHNACQVGLLCICSIIHPECPVFFGRSPVEKNFPVHHGDRPPVRDYFDRIPVANASLRLSFESGSAYLVETQTQYGRIEESKLPLIPRETQFIPLSIPNSHWTSFRVQSGDSLLGPYHFNFPQDYTQLKSAISSAIQYCESTQEFSARSSDFQPSNSPYSASGSDVFSILIREAKNDPVILRFISTLFASIFSSHTVQQPLVADALSKYSQLLRAGDSEIEIAFLVIRQALQSFPSVWSFGFSFLLSNPYYLEVFGVWNAVQMRHLPSTCKIFHASQIFKEEKKPPSYLSEYRADVSGETFFSCMDLVSETGMPRVFPFTLTNQQKRISSSQIPNFQKSEKLKPTHAFFRQMMIPLIDSDFGQEVLKCAQKLVSSWADPQSRSGPEVSDLAADILALLPVCRSLGDSGKIDLDSSDLSGAIIHLDLTSIPNCIRCGIEDESLLAIAVQGMNCFERALFGSSSENWPLRKMTLGNNKGVVDAISDLIPAFILKCVDCIARQPHYQSKFLLSGISTGLRVLPFLDLDIKNVLIGVHRVFAIPHRPTAIQASVVNSYPSSGYIRHDIICNFMDCVSLSLQRLDQHEEPNTQHQPVFSYLQDLIGPFILAKTFANHDGHVVCESHLSTDCDASLWLTSEEMFSLCSRLAHLCDQYQRASDEVFSQVFAAMMHLCALAGIGCTDRTAAVTGLLAKIILHCASTTAGNASTQSKARLTERAKSVLTACRDLDLTRNVIPLLIDTVMNAFCSISLDDDFRESSLGECFEILRVVLYIIQHERDSLGQTFQEENVLKSFQKSLDLLTALFDSKTSRGSMISTKVCEHLLKVITSFDDLLSPRIFVEKLFLIHEIAEQRRSQLALPVKNVVVTIHDSKKHTIERITDAQTCSSCNVEVKWADICTRCIKCSSCSSSEPQCMQLRQAHGWSGLTNIGNTCFMNAVLQQLAAIPWVVNSVLFAKPRPVSEPSEAIDVSVAPIAVPHASPSLLVEFQKLVAEMLYSNSGVVSTREFAGASKFEGESLVLGQQQDAGSYFRSFIDQIEGDLSDTKRQEWRNLFIGSIQTQTIRKCHHDEEGHYVSSKSEDVFGEILMSVTGKKTLQECIASRLCAGERQVYCEQCAKTSTASTQDSLLKLPPILICQFHRASADGSKCLDRPSFPYQSTLDLSPFMSSDATQQSCLYELQGIVLHKGESVRSGHYISIIRERATHPCSRLGGSVDKDPQWWMMNDETVSAVTRETLNELCSFEGLPCSDVHEALPYLLIFTRKHTRGPQAPRSFSSALDRMPAGLRDTSLPFDIFDSETPGAETPGSGTAANSTPTTEIQGFARRKSEGTGAYVKGENFVARLDTVLQHSDGRVPTLSDGSQFVFQNILKRHDARVQSILLCHSYSNLIERMLKRLHESTASRISDIQDLKVGDHVQVESFQRSKDPTDILVITCIPINSRFYVFCTPISGGRETEYYFSHLRLVPKPAPIEDVRAVQSSCESRQIFFVILYSGSSLGYILPHTNCL